MEKIYILKCTSNAEEYIRIKGKISDLKIPVMKSEIQHLDKKIIEFDISDDGGLEIPDLIIYEGIYLVSNHVKVIVENRNTDYIFWKQADIHSEKYGIHETFWIIVPPRIDCIDIDKSDINIKWNFEDGIIPMLEIRKIVIIQKQIGRYEVFKILGVLDNNIYVSAAMYEFLKNQKFEGMDFMEL